MLNNLKYILDIGSSKISLMAVASYANMPKVFAEEYELYDGYMDGAFLAETEIEPVITRLIRNMSAKTRKSINSIFVGVPAEFCKCVCKRISRQFVDLHKVSNADIVNLFESNKGFGDSEGYAVINYSPMQFQLDDGVKTMSPQGKKSSCLIMDASFILAKRSFINLFVQILNSAGVKDVEFLSTSLGQAVALSSQLETNKPIAIVDVGHISTSVCVYKGEGLALLSSFSMGGGHISSDILQVLGMSFAEAELIKRKVILTIESEKNENYQVCSHGSLIKAPINITNQIVRSRIEIIAKVVANVLKVDEMFDGIPVYLTGDGIANFKGVKAVVKECTGLDVKEFKIPLDNSKEKFQTSKIGLAALAKIVV